MAWHIFSSQIQDPETSSIIYCNFFYLKKQRRVDISIHSIFFCSLAEHLRSLTDTGMRNKRGVNIVLCTCAFLDEQTEQTVYSPYIYKLLCKSDCSLSGTEMTFHLTNISLKKRNRNSPPLLTHTLLDLGWNESHPQRAEERSTAGWTQEVQFNTKAGREARQTDTQ